MTTQQLQMNPPTPILTAPILNSQVLPIVETFHSVQGEGAWSGTNAYFIRLALCDVGCPWCDTKISWSDKNHPKISIAQLTDQAKAVNPEFVVITGGEPLIHDLTDLTNALKAVNLRTHLETSGSHSYSGTFDWITLSSKLTNPTAIRYLQAEWNSTDSQTLIFNYVLKNPQWRISLQTHKLLGVQ